MWPGFCQVLTTVAKAVGASVTSFREQFLRRTAVACLLALAVQAVVFIVWTGNLIIGAAAFVLTSVIAVVMLNKSRDELLEPSSRLTSRLDGIVSLGNFGDRIEKPGQSEFDALTDQVNRLLGRLEKHDRAVSDLKAQSTTQLEQQIKQFQAELEEQRQAMKELVLSKAAAEESLARTIMPGENASAKRPRTMRAPFASIRLTM